MNLRKLLCGLLALCLLLTMAPAALMEELEAPVAEVVEELGEVAEAENLTTIGHDDADPALVKDTDVTMYEGDVKTLTYEYDVVGASADTVDGDVVSLARDGKKLRLTAEGAGDTIVTVTLETNTGLTINAIVNVTVKGHTNPSLVNLFDTTGDNITGETLSIDRVGSSMVVYAIAYAGDMTALSVPADYDKIIWSSSNKKVADIVSAGVMSDNVRTGAQIQLKAAGTTKITAVVKGTAVKNSITLKVSDAHKPTKVTIVPDRTGNVFQTLTDKQNIFPINAGNLNLRANIDPADYEYSVTWTVSNTKLAWFLNSKGKKVNSITVVNGNNTNWLPLHINTTKTGTITITAKVYNGKKDTLKVKLINLASANRVWITAGDGITNISGKKVTCLLSDLDVEYSDYNAGSIYSYQGAKVNVVGHILNYVGNEINPSKSQISWTSSNKKVATVSKSNVDGRVAVITSKKEGKTTITMKVTSGTGKTKTSSFTLTVVDPTAPKAIYFVNENNVEISSLTLKKGQKASVNVNAEYVTGANPNAMISYSQLKFSTSDKYTATVSSNGVITAVGKGTAYIKVKTYNNLTKKLKVVVK